MPNINETRISRLVCLSESSAKGTRRRYSIGRYQVTFLDAVYEELVVQMMSTLLEITHVDDIAISVGYYDLIPIITGTFQSIKVYPNNLFNEVKKIFNFLEQEGGVGKVDGAQITLYVD